MLKNDEVKQKRLAIEELKKYPGFENYSDEDSIKAINDLEVVSILLFEIHSRQNSIKQTLTNNS